MHGYASPDGASHFGEATQDDFTIVQCVDPTIRDGMRGQIHDAAVRVTQMLKPTKAAFEDNTLSSDSSLSKVLGFDFGGMLANPPNLFRQRQLRIHDWRELSLDCLCNFVRRNQYKFKVCADSLCPWRSIIYTFKQNCT